MRSLTYRAGVGVAVGRVGAGVFVVVVSDLVAGAAAASCVCSFHGTCVIGRHTFKELGGFEAVVGGAAA